MNTEMPIAAPFSVAGLTLPNRIVMPPLVIWRAGQDGLVTPHHLQHYEQSTGPGLMIVEATVISPEGRLAATQLGLWSDDQIPGLAELARIIHSSGAMAGIQIHHAGNRSTLKTTYGLAPLVPSLTEKSPEGAKEMMSEDIDRLLTAYADAADRAARAGFDYVELHGAHGYLMNQFLSPRDNLRTDEWGGTLQNRMRFTLEAYRRARDRVGSRTVMAIRLGVADGKPGGITTDDGIALARELAALGCPILNISRGTGNPEHVIPEGSPFSSTMHLAGMVKASVPAVVIGIGDVRTPDDANAVLEAGLADLVAVGRATLADPRWALKALGEDSRPIEPCQTCKPGCFHFRAPEKCPARARLAKRGEVPALAPLS